MTSDPSSILNEFACPLCGKAVTAQGNLRGKRVSCPHCAGQFDVPETDAPVPPVRATGASGDPFQFQCLRCRSILEGRSAQCGQQGKCPSCGAVFTIPQVDPRTGLALGAADPGDDGQNPTPVHAYAAAGQQAPRIVRRDDGRAAIECPRCLHQSGVHANGCEACGHPFTMDGAIRPAVVAVGGGPSAWLCLGFGVASLLVPMMGIGAVLGTVAIVCGMLDVRSRTQRHKRPVWTGRTLAGIVCGAMGVAAGLLVLMVGRL